jgi:ABC-type branched-subunit amino acid transport system ATPase component
VADPRSFAAWENPRTSGSRPTIHVENAVKSFDGRVVVDVADLTLGTHPIEGLIGPNGAGKTTLLRMIMHSIALDRGTITLNPAGHSSNGSVVLSDLPAHGIAGLGVVKTNQVIQDFETLTVWDSLLLSVARAADEASYRILREKALFAEHEEEVRWWLDRFPFENPMGFANSAGEKKLLDIIRCLLLKPKVLLLDEPAAGLPDDIRDRIMNVVARKAAVDNISVVIIEHDLEVVWRMSNWVHFMAEGEVQLQGTPEQIRRNATVIEKYLGAEHV